MRWSQLCIDEGRALRIFVILFIVSLTVLLAGLMNPAPLPYPFGLSDKFMHCLGFFVVSIAARLAFLRTPAWLLWSVLLAFAPFSEWLQHTLQPLRCFSWLDILANLSGVVLAAITWKLLSYLHLSWQHRRTN